MAKDIGHQWATRIRVEGEGGGGGKEEEEKMERKERLGRGKSKWVIEGKISRRRKTQKR